MIKHNSSVALVVHIKEDGCRLLLKSRDDITRLSIWSHSDVREDLLIAVLIKNCDIYELLMVDLITMARERLIDMDGKSKSSSSLLNLSYELIDT